MLPTAWNICDSSLLLEADKNTVTRSTWTGAGKKDSGTNSLRQSAAPTPPFWYERSLSSNSGEVILWDTSPPSSQSAGFPNSHCSSAGHLVSLFIGLSCGEQYSKSLTFEGVSFWEHVCDSNLFLSPTKLA